MMGRLPTISNIADHRTGKGRVEDWESTGGGEARLVPLLWPELLDTRHLTPLALPRLLFYNPC